MFEHDHSATRGEMAARRLFVFKHDSPLGNAPAHKLFDRITVKVNEGVRPQRSFADFTVSFDEGALPGGVQLMRFTCDTLTDPVPFIVTAPTQEP